MADTFVISTSQPSGYLNPRSKLEVFVSLDQLKDIFLEFRQIIIPTGLVNKILQNSSMKNEIILATQTGFFIVSVEED